jgi:hypothetical protein
VVFVVAIFFINSNSLNFKNSNEEEGGLAVNTEVLGNLLNKDSDKDGVLDWEEGLWNTDPNSKDTNGDGVSDKKEIEKLKIENGLNQPPQDPETLTKTDKFSQELFTTVAALSQSGELDQMSIDQISESLKEQIQTKTIRVVFTVDDITVVNDNSIEAIKAYDAVTTNISSKYQLEIDPIFILEESMMESGEMDSEVLAKLDPLIVKLEAKIEGYKNMKVPSEFTQPHLSLMNAMQRLAENLIDIRNLENDSLVALGAISKYEENNDALNEITDKFNELLLKKLNG